MRIFGLELDNELKGIEKRERIYKRVDFKAF